MRDGIMVAERKVEEIGAVEGVSLRPAFEDLFRSHHRTVYCWILRIIRNPTAAEDLTIETFWRIHRYLARFDSARSFEPWARRIATRVALDWLRTQGSETTMPGDFFATLPSPALADPGVAAEIRCKVAQALGRLPPKLRVAAVLAVIEELPQRQIALALGISMAAVKLRVFRALRRLRKDLREQGITP